MARYQAFDPKTEIYGANLMSILAAVPHSELEQVLEAHGVQLQANQWYLLQQVLDLLQAIAKAPNATMNLVSLGIATARKTMESLQFTKSPEALHQFLTKSLPESYGTGIRNGDVGWLRGEQIDTDHYTVTRRSPFPDDLFYGSVYEYVRLLRPTDAPFTVAYDETLPRLEQGGEFTRIHVYLNVHRNALRP